MLPRELLQQAFFLHALATEPGRVLPPQKSLLAMMAHVPSASAPSPLHARVERVVHKAFWDEALQSLSSPSPAVQLPRLKLLYNDLHQVLTPLFPQQHPVLLTLAAPLSPTSSPLHSTLALLGEVLVALRRRCAPARDSAIDALLANLASLPPFPASDAPSENPLAALIVSTLRDLISLADVLKRDLADTLLGAMSEAQLADVIRQQARTRERELVLDSSMWGSLDRLGDLWKSWLGSENIWTSRLLRALTSPTPVTCHPEDPHPNSLPPQLFFSRPALLYVQNYLQALVIGASLSSLVRLPAPTSSGPPHDFMSRVWTLLKAEIDRDEYPNAADDETSADDATKLVNLADEVIRAQRLLVSSVPEQDERELRAAVERTLRLQDPVFALLQSRLVRAIEEHQIVGYRGGVDTEADMEKDRIVRIPEIMRTGRVNDILRPSVSRTGTGTPIKRIKPVIVVKGFEDEILVQACGDVVERLIAIAHWTQSVWGDTIPS